MLQALLFLSLSAHGDTFQDRAQAAASEAYEQKRGRLMASLISQERRRLSMLEAFVHARRGAMGTCTPIEMQCFETACFPINPSKTPEVPFEQIGFDRVLNVTHCKIYLPNDVVCEGNPSFKGSGTRTDVTCYPPKGQGQTFAVGR